MDIQYFLTKRLNFIKQFYSVSAAPFIEKKRMIELQEKPYVPPYSEDGEPPFLEEWIEADESLHVLAYSCISMLSAALQLYFSTWVKQSAIPVSENARKGKFEKGWLVGYKSLFTQHFEIDFKDAPVNFKILEEVILARNRIEHPSFISSNRTQFLSADLAKLHRPFFVDEQEAQLISVSGNDGRSWFLPPTLHISQEQLFEAIAEVQRLTQWFELQIECHLYPK